MPGKSRDGEAQGIAGFNANLIHSLPVEAWFPRTSSHSGKGTEEWLAGEGIK